MNSKILLVALTICFIAYAYFHPPQFLSSSTKNDTICMNYAKEPFSKLKVDLIHNMTSGYKQNQLSHIKAVMDDDAHSISFDLETLKRFIYHIEINAQKNGVSKDDLGLRMYYSRYPNKDTWSNQYDDLKGFIGNSTTEEFQERHTLVMIPTMRREGVHYDFNPLHSETYTEKMSGFEKYQPTNTTESIPGLTVTIESSTINNNTTAQNHGSLIPPITGTGESF